MSARQLPDVSSATPVSRRPSVHHATLALGGTALVLGIYTGLARGGIEHRFVGADLHAVLMVLAFFGTVFAVDRAAEVAGRWASLAPVASASSALALPLIRPVGGALLVLAGGILTATYLVGDAGQDRTVGDAVGLLGALAWVTAATLWLFGAGPIRITPLLAAFLVLTLVRTQAVRDQRAGEQGALGGAVFRGAALFSLGAVGALGWRSGGLVLAGVGLVALAAALAPHARRRLAGRRGGLPRFEGICSGVATAWLAASGLLWIALGAGASGALLHDAVVHSLFLGGVFTQVMGLTPALLADRFRIPPVFTASAWLPVVVLQVSVLVRIGADLANSPFWREIALHGNVASLLLFLLLAGVGLRRAGRIARRQTS